jgi:hypothetical protein
MNRPLSLTDPSGFTPENRNAIAKRQNPYAGMRDKLRGTGSMGRSIGRQGSGGSGEAMRRGSNEGAVGGSSGVEGLIGINSAVADAISSFNTSSKDIIGNGKRTTEYRSELLFFRDDEGSIQSYTQTCSVGCAGQEGLQLKTRVTIDYDDGTIKTEVISSWEELKKILEDDKGTYVKFHLQGEHGHPRGGIQVGGEFLSDHYREFRDLIKPRLSQDSLVYFNACNTADFSHINVDDDGMLYRLSKDIPRAVFKGTVGDGWGIITEDGVGHPRSPSTKKFKNGRVFGW